MAHDERHRLNTIRCDCLVPPAELESLLLSHPEVADAGVIGVYSESQETELPRAYIALKRGLVDLSMDQQRLLERDIIEWVDGKVSILSGA